MPGTDATSTDATRTDAMRVYLDSCVLIYRIEQTAPWAARAQEQLNQVETSGATVIVSELTRLECRVRPIALGRADMLNDYDAFFARPMLGWQALDRPVFELATRLRAESRLKTADALHLAAALSAGCHQFITNDKRLAAAAAGHLEVRALNA